MRAAPLVSPDPLLAAPHALSQDPAGRGLSVALARTPAELEHHAAAWDDLAAHAAEPNPFFESHALLPAWRHLDAAELEVVLVWAPPALPGQPPALVGLFPIVRVRRYKGLPVTALSIWKHLYSYVDTPLVDADRVREVLAALFGWLRSETDAAVFEWRGISADGPFRHALTDTLNQLRLEAFHDCSHTRALFRPAATAEAYLARALGGKKRKELRRQERRLGELGQVSYDELAAAPDPSAALDHWLDEFVALEQRGWKGQGGTALGSDPAGLAVFRAMAHSAFARGRWMTLALRLDGRALAMKCNLRAGDGAVAFKIAYDEAYARYSPGVLLEIEQIQRLHAAGAPAWMDSGAAPDHPMIGHLWRDRLTIETVTVPTGRAPGELAVAAMPLVRWGTRAVRDAVRRLQPKPQH
jgi:CelD/BcsL family acetyltransferase involved in cellulose biosynthesis